MNLLSVFSFKIVRLRRRRYNSICAAPVRYPVYIFGSSFSTETGSVTDASSVVLSAKHFANDNITGNMVGKVTEK